MVKQPENRGFLREDIKIEDGVFGSSLSFVARGVEVQPDGNWTPYLPPEEYQNRIFNGSIETNSCATFGTLNQVEMYIRRVFDKDPDYADRFLAKLSGTTAQGNSPHTVLETLRKQGVVDEPQWPWTQDIISWAQYFADIPKNLLTLALAWPLEYVLWHDYVPTDPNTIRNALKYSPVAVSVLELIDSDGLYYKPDGLRDTHWAVCVAMKPNGNYIIYDTYAPFIKEFRAGYKFEVAKVITIQRNVKVESFWTKFITWLKQAYGV